jgi:hypothetical protein
MGMKRETVVLRQQDAIAARKPGLAHEDQILSRFPSREGKWGPGDALRSFYGHPGATMSGPNRRYRWDFLAGLPRGSPLTRPITVRASINSPSLAVCARQHSVSTACWNTIRNSIPGFATPTPTVSQKSLWRQPRYWASSWRQESLRSGAYAPNRRSVAGRNTLIP